MTRTTSALACIAVLAATASTSSAFINNGAARKRPFIATTNSHATRLDAFANADPEYFFADTVTPPVKENATLKSTEAAPAPSSSLTKKKAAASKKKAATANNHKEGIFSPVVLAAKQILGEKRLNKIRADAISLHSDVIGNFVDTSNSELGETVLTVLFQAADKDGNGKLEEQELAAALRALGFEWVQEKQVKGILKRADANENGAIEFDEFLKEAPKTLRTNLIKLAKKNGGELGFLV